MSRVDPTFAYLTILAIIQPARVQDIEANASDILAADVAEWLIEGGRLRKVHQSAREAGLVIAVRKGVYFLAPAARLLVRRRGLQKAVDNRRMFLMKEQRKWYK